MFYGCTNITSAPDILITTLPTASDSWCYEEMFYGCSKLKYVKCLTTNITDTNTNTYRWLYGVASRGTFVKNANATSWPIGVSGIPLNWTVQDAT